MSDGSQLGVGEIAVVPMSEALAVVTMFLEQGGTGHYSTFGRHVCLCCDAPAPDAASAEYLMVMCVASMATIVMQPMCRVCTAGKCQDELNQMALAGLTRLIPSFQPIPPKSAMH